MSCDSLKLIYSIESDFIVEAANIAALVFPETKFKLILQQVSNFDAALVLPKAPQYLLSQAIGSHNLSITFKDEKVFSKNINFRVCFFPKLQAITISGYCSQGTAYLIYTSPSNYNWLNSKGYKIDYPDTIGEKFEYLAPKFYPFFEEFVL
ncbi:hypothetical protein NIES2101_40925 [Calothrix sp. HK-06]|nr:hypothetical protein NIES2101_40925 [Calothrix sp. HK-06]